MDTATLTTVVQGVTVLASITAILAIVNLIKRVWPNLPSNYWPLIAVLLGVTFSVLDYLFIASALYLAIVGGLKLGLTACGLWDVTPDSSSAKAATVTEIEDTPEDGGIEPTDDTDATATATSDTDAS